MKRYKLSELEYQDSFDHQKSVLFTEDDFGANAKMQVLSVKPGQYIPPHHHAVRTEAFYILEGTGEIVINGSKVVCTRDDIAICQPGDVHSMRNLSEDEYFRVLIVRTNDPGNEDMIWEEKI
jgi:quercetin dioxygenase-like cupin family protein